MLSSPIRRILKSLILTVALLGGCSAASFSQTFTTGGTGFFISSDGYILTNYHVVEGATGPIVVTLHDGTELEAKLVDYSPTIEDGGGDAALLKVDGRSLGFLELADSDDVQLFDQVIAMGFPLSFTLGVSLNITGGNVTAFRTLEDSLDVFQIDAVVNPGNSGGPLLNAAGQVIGLVTAGITELHGTPIQGVSFAVPINVASRLASKYIPDLHSAEVESPSLPSRDIISKATPAVVYITWEDAYQSKGEHFEDFSREREWFATHWNSKGFIEITQANDGYLTSIDCPSTASGPFFEVDLLFTQYGDGMAGLVLIPADGTKWSYTVLIDADGHYVIYKRSPDGSTWRSVKQWTYSSSIHTGTDIVNHIAVEVTPLNSLLVSFNDGAAISVNVSISVGGGIGIAVGTFDGATTVRFDNLKIHKGSSRDSTTDMQ